MNSPTRTVGRRKDKVLLFKARNKTWSGYSLAGVGVMDGMW